MDIRRIGIDKIGLSVRSSNALRRAGIHTVEEMMSQTEESLTEIRNLGRKSIEEILDKQREYFRLESAGASGNKSAGSAALDLDEWMASKDGKQVIKTFLREKKVRIDALELLPTRAYSLLLHNDVEYLDQIIDCTVDDLLDMPWMKADCAVEIQKAVSYFLRENSEWITKGIRQESADSVQPGQPVHPVIHSVYDLLRVPSLHDRVLEFVKTNDIRIEMMGLTGRTKGRLLLQGYRLLNQIIFLTKGELLLIKSMGEVSADEVLEKVDEYLLKNEKRMIAFCSMDDSALWDEETIEAHILALYDDQGFRGLSLKEMTEEMATLKSVPEERIKKAIGRLLGAGKLEYVDYRCHRVYRKLEDSIDACPDLSEKEKHYIHLRLQGKTLEEIGQSQGVTRERVRQVVSKAIPKLRSYYGAGVQSVVFDEEYYQHLFETYAFDKKDAEEWLGIPESVFRYLEALSIKQGNEDLLKAVDDKQLDAGLRLKIKSYLNRNKILINGKWVEKRRSELERALVPELCKDSIRFDDFAIGYNKYLEKLGVEYDETIYYTNDVIRTRKNSLRDARFVLWKQFETLRYYDIDSRDYTELLEVLNLDAYQNTERSTLKWMKDYPEIMERFDIRDQYDLHDLLKKVVPDGSYHHFHCERTPIIRFGTFDRAKAFRELLLDNAPVSQDKLVDLLYEEYGYDKATIVGSYLRLLDIYYHQGMYTVGQKRMSSDNRDRLSEALKEDFYYYDEIRSIYRTLAPGADLDEINPFNLKMMGFVCASKSCVRNYPNAETYFEYLLTEHDITDLSELRRRHTYNQSFYSRLDALRKNRDVIEYEPGQLINIRRLEAAGITKDMLQDFCDDVFDYVDDDTYFSIQSLKQDGFKSELFEQGFDDWFYANLLVFDPRFSHSQMFSAIVLYKGVREITIRTFEESIVNEHRSIDVYDLQSEMEDRYGCKVQDKSKLIYKLEDSRVYYDRILDRLYADRGVYERELDDMEGYR